MSLKWDRCSTPGCKGELAPTSKTLCEVHLKKAREAMRRYHARKKLGIKVKRGRAPIDAAERCCPTCGTKLAADHPIRAELDDPKEDQ